ncbi:hypothetical protein BDV37DRAFT_235571 [Aspergillus pseudonomiae]|uniref:Uncharacterized protein n=1 Tax=Aspergillus pseudonomiae TaxID=1506151 RepID=A0A5N7DUK2_9EURO|nr:uncharacterized protein BDV37DRAFT_235571 [Aspergillus pseudonomiae]KAE8410046.1 hypothetical protein BDV37DRAFT_235571 [Aspergillus pseudonomiae]
MSLGLASAWAKVLHGCDSGRWPHCRHVHTASPVSHEYGIKTGWSCRNTKRVSHVASRRIDILHPSLGREYASHCLGTGTEIR